MPILSRLRSPSIARKLILSIVLFSSCFTIIFTGLQLRGDYRQDLQAIDENFDLIERGSLEVITNSLWIIDQTQLDLVLKGVLSSDHIHQVVVDTGETSTSFGSLPPGDVITKNYSLTYSRGGKNFEMGMLRVTASLEGVYGRLLEKLWFTLAGNAVKTFAVSIFVFLLFQWVITRHLHAIAAYTRVFDERRFDVPLTLDRKSRPGDELDRVVVAINAMRINLGRSYSDIESMNDHLEGLVEDRTRALHEAQADLVLKERLAALGQLTATVSHELRNPLGALRTAVAVIRRLVDGSNPLLVESAAIADRSITRCDAIISDLFDYTRVHPLSLTPIWADRWLEGLLDEYQLPEGIEFRREFNSGVEICFDSERVRRILLNLLDNATQAMIGEGDVEDENRSGNVLTVASRVWNDRLEISVRDTGPGIPSDIRDNIFEPLFSTKSFGVGLGLSIVMQIAQQHGGGIEIADTASGGGAELTLWLPLAAPELQEVS